MINDVFTASILLNLGPFVNSAFENQCIFVFSKTAEWLAKPLQSRDKKLNFIQVKETSENADLLLLLHDLVACNLTWRLESTASKIQFQAPNITNVIVLERFVELLPQERITEEANILPRFRGRFKSEGAEENVFLDELFDIPLNEITWLFSSGA